MPKGRYIEVRGLEEIRDRMAQFPRKFTEVISATLKASLIVFQENVPSYPPKPVTSTYRRTGTLGRSIGVSQSGQKLGESDIFEVKKVGEFQEARFGTNLDYAPYVIGEKQSRFHAQYWWRLVQVIGLSYQKILKLFDTAVDKMVAYIEGQEE